ncbi:lytic transglycosylase domain-containing protein [Maricaulis sp.]|uniref:lytic transglycosylase domain-containing protein n=1 Tax=Maricaulis sp. TaxID=1486257 RepID=UPI003296DFA9
MAVQPYASGPSVVETPFERHIVEAAQRFDIPARWIDAVIAVESDGDAAAISVKGARGLLQIMPATWRDLRARYGLGHDPFDPRENVFAGTAYLRELYDRFGVPGAFAAYNAGPDRYRDHRDTGRPLPRETRRYLAALAQRLGIDMAADSPAPDIPAVRDWRRARLFAVSHDNRTGDASDTTTRLWPPQAGHASDVDRVTEPAPSEHLFVPANRADTP